MANILVLGGGQQGRVIALELAKNHSVAVADIVSLSLQEVEGIVVDLSDFDSMTSLIAQYDFAVGALPAKLGFLAAKAAISAKRSFIDVAFYEEDPWLLHLDALAADVTIMPDCGLAPGISNLIIGRALKVAPLRRVQIYVGGVAADPDAFLGYVLTWSPDDLIDEYIRPARYISAGKQVEIAALEGYELIDIEGVGQMEAFFTDGLRTLLRLPGVVEMTEKTLRWPGHLEKMRPLLEQGKLKQILQENCLQGDDLVVMQIQIDDTKFSMIARPKDGLSAMARTTALTTAAFASWYATGNVSATGIVPPEDLGRDQKAYDFIMNKLAEHGIEIRS
jgi:saccharopine dehydrogenase-like NADP-dependent oxidoreductase